jgi:hypothetical protein
MVIFGVINTVDANAGKFSVTPGQIDSGAVTIDGAVNNSDSTPSRIIIRIDGTNNGWDSFGYFYDQGVNTTPCEDGDPAGSHYFMRFSGDKCLCWYTNVGWVIWNQPTPPLGRTDNNCLKQPESDPVVYKVPPQIAGFVSWVSGSIGGTQDVVCS